MGSDTAGDRTGDDRSGELAARAAAERAVSPWPDGIEAVLDRRLEAVGAEAEDPARRLQPALDRLLALPALVAWGGVSSSALPGVAQLHALVGRIVQLQLQPLVEQLNSALGAIRDLTGELVAVAVGEHDVHARLGVVDERLAEVQRRLNAIEGAGAGR